MDRPATPIAPWTSVRTGRLTSRRAVDPLPQQVRMTVVAGVLLDHVDVHPTKVHLDLTIRVDEGRLERAPCRRAGELDLLGEGGEVLLYVSGPTSSKSASGRSSVQYRKSSYSGFRSAHLSRSACRWSSSQV